MPGEVTTEHCNRQAYIYIRQSSQQQVAENKAGQAVQYNLVDRAKVLGWHQGQIEIIDEDLGVSAAGAKKRSGYEKLLTNICLGNVGAIFILYSSRLARNGHEWHRALEMCSLFNVLIIDRDTIYDPQLASDRLWLGMQGSFSEYELKQMQIRAREAIMHKASKGEFIKMLPAGLVATDDNRIEIDPDKRITEAIGGVFKRFGKLSSIRQVSMWYQEHKYELPVREGNKKGFPIAWRIPVYSTIQRIITNPLYAGIYIYPKTKTKISVVDGTVKKSSGYRTTSEDNVFVIEDLFSSYITKEQYYRNQQMISENANKHGQAISGAVREGASILCGLLRCGHCGRKLCVRYRSTANSPYYFCRGARSLNASKGCISFNSQKLEQLISAEIIKVLHPHAIDAAIVAEQKYAEGLQERRSAHYNALEQARYEASRLERQYNSIDPENYLVSKTVASRWQQSLEKVDNLERQYNQIIIEHQDLSETQRDKLYELAADLSQVWDDPTSDDKIKSRLVRLLVKEIIIKLPNNDTIAATVHWQGGVHTQYELSRRRQQSKANSKKRSNLSTKQLLEKLAFLCEDHQIARILNRLRYVATDDNVAGNWTEFKVKELRDRYQIAAFSKEAYGKKGIVNLKTASHKLHVSMDSVLKMIKGGIIEASQVIEHAPWEIAQSELTKVEVKHYISTMKRGRPNPYRKDQLKLIFEEK